MLQQAQPPKVIFDTVAVCTKDKDGVAVYTNKYMVNVSAHGSKDSIDKEAEQWLKELLAKSVTRGEFDPQANEYEQQYKHFSACFEAYKANSEMPLDGTPIRMCLSFSPAERAQCEGIKVFTLEVLANANEETLQRMGMGSRALKIKAQKMLEGQQGGKLAEQNAALQVKVEELTRQLAELRVMVGQDPDEANSVQKQMQDMQAMMATLMANSAPKKPGRPAKTQ